jgi:two-component system sensor histidine kinase PhoQ
MNQIVSYQLQKAGSVSDIRINKPVDLVEIIGKLLSALEKVYQEKAVEVQCRLPDQILLRMDEGDCLEVVGNLLDNAFKYGRRKIFIMGREVDEKHMLLKIDDDGEGLPVEELELILNRGTRLDEATEGQGIGLAVVADIVESYNIDLKFAASEHGGLEVSLVFQTI